MQQRSQRRIRRVIHHSWRIFIRRDQQTHQKKKTNIFMVDQWTLHEHSFLPSMVVLPIPLNSLCNFLLHWELYPFLCPLSCRYILWWYPLVFQKPEKSSKLWKYLHLNESKLSSVIIHSSRLVLNLGYYYTNSHSNKNNLILWGHR